MLHKNYATFYAIICFWLQLPLLFEANKLWVFNEVVEKNSAQAACSVIQTYFAPSAKGLQIRYATLHARNFLDEVLSCMPVIPVKVIDAVKDLETPLSTYGYNFLIIDSPTDLDAIKLTRKTADIVDMEQNFLICVLDFRNSLEEEQKNVNFISNFFWQLLYNEVKILFSVSKNITNLYTYRPFARNGQCKQATVKSLNTMIDESWMHPLNQHFSAGNMTNLHGCPLKVATWNSPPYLSYFPWRNGLDRFDDFEGRLIVELAKKLNFTLKIVHPKEDELRGSIFENGTTTGAISMLQLGEADFSLGCFRYSLDRRKVLSSLLPYFQTSQVYGVALRERRLSSTKMLASAFDTTTWFCLYFSLQLTSIVAYFLYRCQQQNILARNILGRPISSSYILNLFGVLLGIPINRLPVTNFTRYTIVLWSIYGVIMRTAYLSLLFKILQTDMFLEPPKSFKALISEHYKLVMIQNTYASTYENLKDGNLIAKIIIQNVSEEATFDYMTQHPSELLASVSPKEFLVYYMAKTKNAAHFSILPQTIFSHHVTMYLPKFSYLTKHFDHIVKNLRYFGLIDYWSKKSLDLSKLTAKNEKLAKAITLTQLLGVFKIYQLAILFSCITFGLEILTLKMRFKRVIKKLNPSTKKRVDV